MMKLGIQNAKKLALFLSSSDVSMKIILKITTMTFTTASTISIRFDKELKICIKDTWVLGKYSILKKDSWILRCTITKIHSLFKVSVENYESKCWRFLLL